MNKIFEMEHEKYKKFYGNEKKDIRNIKVGDIIFIEKKLNNERIAFKVIGIRSPCVIGQCILEDHTFTNPALEGSQTPIDISMISVHKPSTNGQQF